MKKGTRKPFVVPQIKEEASLVGVTLISGGGGQTTFRSRSQSRRHGHGGHSHRHGRDS
jgi:hypothetical protein